MLKTIARVGFVLLVVLAGAHRAAAQNRWAVIISGASGGDKYAEQMAAWRGDLRAALVDRYQFKPEFVKIFVDEAATSGDKKQHYEQRGQLTTERALLDDNGDGKGREATAEGPDGGIARLAYLDSETVSTSANPELAELIKKRRALATRTPSRLVFKSMAKDRPKDPAHPFRNVRPIQGTVR